MRSLRRKGSESTFQNIPNILCQSILVSMVTNVLDIFGDLDRIASHRFPG